MAHDVLDDLWRWVLLDGDRNLFGVHLSAGVFLACLVAVALDLLTVVNAAPVRSLLSSGIGGMVSFITIVLTINQLILAEEFGTMHVREATVGDAGVPPQSRARRWPRSQSR